MEEHRRGLEMLEQIEIREIICGVISSSEFLEIHSWVTEKYNQDQLPLGTRVVYMDVEDVKTTFYDTLRMARLRSRYFVLQRQPEFEVIPRFGKDDLRWIPRKTFLGNGVSWPGLSYLPRPPQE